MLARAFVCRTQALWLFMRHGKFQPDVICKSMPGRTEEEIRIRWACMLDSFKQRLKDDQPDSDNKRGSDDSEDGKATDRSLDDKQVLFLRCLPRKKVACACSASTYLIHAVHPLPVCQCRSSGPRSTIQREVRMLRKQAATTMAALVVVQLARRLVST